ncbi:MAG: TatD family hydrolase [Chlamydiia bacterium]|nr:TatD family hydrolase [Chlamydiia bacterium]
MLTDSHAHLSIPSLREKVPKLIERAVEAGVSSMINIATTPAELEHASELHTKYPWIYVAGSTTPHDVEKAGEADFETFAKAAREGKLVAVGETGLDYHYRHSKPSVQQHFVRRYFRLANACGLPVIIHCRDAFNDLFRLIDEECKGEGVLHCFTGTVAEAQEVIKRGWYLSLSGIVTFKKSDELRKVAVMVPDDHLLIETDAPYLAPVPHRGRQNEPAYLRSTAELVASLRGQTIEELAIITTRNARTLFHYL